MSYPAKAVMVALFLMPTMLSADETSAEEPPSLELLEFLGEWETEDGDWIDPELFTDVELAELLSVAGGGEHD